MSKGAGRWTSYSARGDGMNEAEWLACTDPQKMLEFLRGRVSDRQLRLFAVACSRQIWENSMPGRICRAIETAEKYADGLVTEQDLRRVHSMACESAHAAQRRGSSRRFEHPRLDSEKRLFFAADTAHPHKPFLIGRLGLVYHDATLRAISRELLHDIIGNIFRPVNFSPAVLSWNDGTVKRLAQTAYDERHLPEGTLDKTRLAVLADALEEAGCRDTEVLDHLRGPGPHVRGCWPVDLCLGKS